MNANRSIQRRSLDVHVVDGPVWHVGASAAIAAVFPGEECHDFGSAMDKLGALAPVTVLALAARNSFGLACIPVIFHGANL
jgi:hypothetical protein